MTEKTFKFLKVYLDHYEEELLPKDDWHFWDRVEDRLAEFRHLALAKPSYLLDTDPSVSPDIVEEIAEYPNAYRLTCDFINMNESIVE